MFRIEDGRDSFYQWDTNRKIIVEDSTIKELHFCNKTEECSLVVDVVDGVANVPNILLQTDWDIRVYAFTGDYTKVEKRFKVVARTKPTDYAYTETEVRTWDSMREASYRMSELQVAEAERRLDEQFTAEREEWQAVWSNNLIDGLKSHSNLITENKDNITILKSRVNNLENSVNTNSLALWDDIDKSASALRTTQTADIIHLTDIDYRRPNGKQVGVVNKNLIPFPYRETTKTTNGITFTVKDDGSITANGTATADAIFSIYNFIDNNNQVLPYLTGGIFVSGCPTGGSGTTYYMQLDYIGENDTGKGITITDSQVSARKNNWGKSIVIVIKKGYSASNLVFRPMAERGLKRTAYRKSVADLTPDEHEFTIIGKNLVDTETVFNEAGAEWLGDSEWCFDSNAVRALYSNRAYFNSIPLDSNKQYTLSFTSKAEPHTDGTLNTLLFRFDYVDGTYSDYVGCQSTEYTKRILTTTKPVRSLTLTYNRLSKSWLKEFQLEVGDTATLYEPYICEDVYMGGWDGTIISDSDAEYTTIIPTPGLTMTVEYNKDINKAFAELQEQIATLAANV